jgi:hypothetical protein
MLCGRHSAISAIQPPKPSAEPFFARIQHYCSGNRGNWVTGGRPTEGTETPVNRPGQRPRSYWHTRLPISGRAPLLVASSATRGTSNCARTSSESRRTKSKGICVHLGRICVEFRSILSRLYVAFWAIQVAFWAILITHFLPLRETFDTEPQNGWNHDNIKDPDAPGYEDIV